MKRAHFIQSMMTLTGTAFIYGCKEAIEDAEEIIVPKGYTSPTVAGAKQWFDKDYLGSMVNARTQKTSVSRKLNWADSKKVKSGKHDFIWIPVDYEDGKLGTALLMWRPGEEYIQKLAQYLSWSITEGFVAYRKPNGDYDGFLAQLAYDPTKSDINEPTDLARFSGLVVNADLNERILRSWRFLEGKMVSYSNPDNIDNSRVAGCVTYYTQYSTVSGQSCGMNCHSVTYSVHTVPNTVCDGGTGSDQGFFGSGANNSGDWYGYGSGGGSTPPPRPTPITNKTALALDANSWERTTFNTRLTDIASAVGLGASSADITLSKATTMANALSLSNSGVVAKISPAVTIMGKALAGVGVLTSGYSVVMAIGKTEDFNWTGQDGLNLVATVASGVALFGNPVGWWVIGLTLASSGISIGIAIYDAQH